MDTATEAALANAQAGAQGLSNELLAGQEVHIINRLVESHRRDKLTGDEARVGIGVISELRSLRVKMEQAVMLGEEAARNITHRRNRP